MTLPLPDASCACPDASPADLAAVDEIVREHGTRPEAAIPILQALQRHYNYLPEAALRRVCELTEITPEQIVGVSTFYPRFRHVPAGKHVISVCHGTACHVKGAPQVSEALQRALQLRPGDDTSADGLFTLQRVDCLGCCTLAPVVQIDSVTYGHLTPDMVETTLQDFLEMQRRAGASGAWAGASSHPRGRGDAPAYAEIHIGAGSCCLAGGSLQVREALEESVRDWGLPVLVKPVGCVGMCHQTPLVEVHVPGRPSAMYARVQAEDAPAIVQRHFAPQGALRRARSLVQRGLDFILTDEVWEPVTRYSIHTRDGAVGAFLGGQQHLATELYGALDPLDLDDYLAHDGFAALRRCRVGAPVPGAQSPADATPAAGPAGLRDDEAPPLSPDDIIAEISAAGLRGRGGAGFPSARKWRLVRDAEATPKYVVCNGDEGDPGAFMDRMLLESYPYRIIEGLAIAAVAVGATEAFFYIRHEYGLAWQRMEEAIRRCEERGLLGDLKLRIMQGAGAFVCGEETGLIASLEGRRGMPRHRPPFPAEEGLWGRPTLVNNVETLALVPWIIRRGATAFAALGTHHSKGTKVFSLTGKVARGGLIEVPMGATIRQIVEEIGGGVAEGRRFKAVQVGGPSGGCVSAELADTAVDYEALSEVGAIMGSGGLVVLDDSDCMVDIARYFLRFTQDQSCGKCTLCRIGT
ncbi:MAG: NAD(P)H-dependent oxidoreductase subunit E, partial [Armatimonadetes bacterium]|nr:NAD(P)H-dependent oxidoreductase subunit E [Armatimonadota bacterium]